MNGSCLTGGEPEPQQCFCVGPQNGDPVCPCQMRQVNVRNGRLVREIDLGPAPTARKIDPALRRVLDKAFVLD